MRPRLTAALVLAAVLSGFAAAADPADKPPLLPFLGEEARKRGIELPATFGIGVVYYHLDRAIEISDVRVGRNGEAPQSVSDFAHLGSDSRVDNVNLKADVWILPFLNLYAIVGGIWNESQTTIDVMLPPLLPGGAPREKTLTVPTEMTGTVGGLGMTLAGGYGPLFFAADVNAARADLGFDDEFKAVVTSVRGGWNGRAGSRPFRAWVNATYWDTFAEATGTVTDPDDGGTLKFEVDQGPVHPWTFGLGSAYSPTKWLDIAVDTGTDFNGGWYVALVPVFRF
ncbi:MAG TPA: hypothetical protein VJ826_07100 [Candidatus Polarisedimenticolaceae bacterium]|nr:hypothetical protein [Candidatus Polarisedimenticolaceae bacterium]